LLFAACLPVVFAVDDDCKKRNLIGTDPIYGTKHCQR
jgi:hypothetical protein